MMIIMLSGMDFLLGSCWLFVSTVDDMKYDLNECANEPNSTKVKQQLCDIVRVYSDVKELSIRVRDRLKCNVFYSFSCQALNRACCFVAMAISSAQGMLSKMSVFLKINL